MGLINDDRIGIRNVETGFNNIGGNKNVIFFLDEPDHHLLKLMTFHLPVGYTNSRIRNEFINYIRDLFYIADPVVNKEHLPPSFYFMTDGITDNHFIECVQLSRDR